MGRLARQFHPSGKDVVELQRGKIGIDAETAVTADLSTELDRNGTAHRGTEIESATLTARVIERGLQFDIGIAIARFAVIQRGRLPVDLDVTLDLVALIV